jgi:glycyl-tRNA synthetase beta chain
MSDAPGRRDFLVEVGSEELPPKALLQLESAFAASIVSQLDQLGLKRARVESFSSPRRLAVLVRRLPIRQPDQAVTRRGPPVRAAFDAASQPTRAAAAFAASCGVELTHLGRESDAKGNEYLAFSGIKAGAETAQLLPGIVQVALDALPIPKRMRWGAGEAQFVRPVHWLVLLFGDQVLPATLLDTPAGDTTRGHRFMAPRALRLRAPAAYERTLLNRGKVIARFAARRDRIREQVLAAAATLGGHPLIGDALLDEVTALVEWPVAVAGQFEERFLKLPREVLISTLQDHQRYFAVATADGTLLPWFITVSNIESRDPDVVRHGNERVVRPRLADAAFFYEQDRKQPLAARREGLDAVTFQAKLGSIGDKVSRVGALARKLTDVTRADADHVRQAAELCKCDLLSAMVGEFPELQGIMGRYYALADGLNAEVAEALREHYLPRGAGDALPATPTGLTVALADKIDTVCGIFAIGQKPTGTRDPFGLRRAAIGVLRIALEKRLPLDLRAAIDASLAAQPVQEATANAELLTFFMERLRAQYLEQPGSGITTEMFDAVLAARPPTVIDFDDRLRALAAFLRLPAAASLAAANKRSANILRKSLDPAATIPGVHAELLRIDAEQRLHRAMSQSEPGIDAALRAGDYAGAFAALAALRPEVDGFFDQVLVNDPDAALRDNRLALLGELRALFTRIADLSLLPG